MSRIRINAYGVSDSVNLLTAEIRSIQANAGLSNVYRLSRDLPNSRFRGREGDLIVNWGSARDIPERVIGLATLLNNPRAVNTASDKLKAFAALTAGGVKTVPSTSDREEAQAWLDEGHHVFCRCELRGHSGSGIVVASNHPIEDAGNVEIVDTLPSVPLYTRGVSAQHREYRIHVFKGVILFIQQKRRASGYRENPNYSNVVRNHGNGWVYSHNQITQPNAEVLSEAIKAVEAIGLDFGAVDVLSRQDEAWVLEVNTAPGLTGDTNRANYANAIIAVASNQPVRGIEQFETHLTLNERFPDWQEQAAEVLTGATADGQELLETETPRFSEGDRVRLSEAGRNEFEHSFWNPHDELGFVIEVYQGLTVAWDNGEYNTYDAEHLELVPLEEDRPIVRTLNGVSGTPAESSAESPLSVGDRVTLSDVGRRAMFHSRQNPHDFAGTVSGTDLYPMEYSVIWDNGEYNVYRRAHLDLILDTDEQTPTEIINEVSGIPDGSSTESPLSIGDRVTLSDVGGRIMLYPNQNPHDFVGTVSGMGLYPMEYSVIWDNGEYNTYEHNIYNREHLTVINEGDTMVSEESASEGRGLSVSELLAALDRIPEDSDVSPVEAILRESPESLDEVIAELLEEERSQSLRFSVDDLVVMSPTGVGRYPDEECNPHNGVGSIVSIIRDEHPGFADYSVYWDNGETNTYMDSDLSPIGARSEESEFTTVRADDGGVLPVGSRVQLTQSGRGHYRDSRSNPHNEIGTIRSNTADTDRGLYFYEVVWTTGTRNFYRDGDLAVVEEQGLSQPSLELTIGARVRLSEQGRQTYPATDPSNPHELLGRLVDFNPDRGFPYSVDWDNGSSNIYREGELLAVENQSSQDTQSPVTIASGNIGEVVVGTTVRMLRTRMRPAAPVGSIGVVRSIIGGGLYVVDWEGQDNNQVGSLRGELEIVSRPEAQTTFEIGARVRLAEGASHETAIGVLPEGVTGVVLAINESGFVEVNWDYNNFFTCHRIDDVEVIPATQVTATFDVGARVRFAEGVLIDLDRGALPEGISGVITETYEDGFVEVNWDNNNLFSRQHVDDLVPAPTARMPVSIVAGSRVVLTPAYQATFSDVIPEGATGIVHDIHQDGLFEIHWDHNEYLVTCHPLSKLELASTVIEDEEQAAEFIPYTDGVYYILETDDGRFVGEYSAECRGFWDTQGEMRYEDDVTVITEVNLHA